MIKVVLVDDEKESRQGLRQLLDWKDLGMVIVGEAENGVEALPLIRERTPDIVLLDIKMPRMDGIECAQHIRKILPHVNLIFISGYGEKEYLKAAIKLRAVDFIDKPVHIPELKKLLVDTADQLHEKEKKRREEAWSYREHLRDRDILARKLLDQLIAKRNEASSILFYCEQLHIKLHRSDLLCCVLCEMAGNSEPGLISTVAVSDALGAFLPRDGFLCGKICDTQLAVFLFGDYVNTFSGHSFEKIQSAISNLSPGLTVTIGVGKVVRGIDSAYRSYQTAQEVIQHKFIFGLGRVFCHKEQQADDAGQHLQALIDIKRDAVSKLNRFDASAVAGLNALAATMKRHPFGYAIAEVKDLYIDIFLHFISLCKAGDMYGDESEQKWIDLINSLTMDELNAFLTEKISGINIHKSELNNYSFRVRNAVRYLVKNYAHDVSVEDISGAMGLSKAYACSLFKKETSSTINQYLESIRIHEASRLLKKSNMRITEIARQVGYSNAAYFIAVFKKTMGMNPKEYRDKL